MVPVMNDTKWEELRLAMYSLKNLCPQWRTKDVETGFIPEWDKEWFYHFRNGGYKSIEWVEIRSATPKQDSTVREILKKIHVPGEKIDEGYRVFGYTKPGQEVKYIE